MWTQFWDMHSGGGSKESYEMIYIEAPEEEAEVIFYNVFGHSSNRVTCTCCGEDYAISSHESLAQLTGYDRGCRNLETPQNPETGLYQNDDPVMRSNLYVENGENPPDGYKIAKSNYRNEKYTSVEDYKKREDVLIISADQISDEDRKGEVPEEGYIWVD